MESFVDHVFLERHLEPWCPAQGPLRDFMDVVCVCLSKNPYMSGSKKVDYIHWFRDYFTAEEQQDILRIAGALEWSQIKGVLKYSTIAGKVVAFS